MNVTSVKKNILLIFLTNCVGLFSFAQRVEEIIIPWRDPQTVTQGNVSMTIPSIQNQSMDGRKPNFAWQKKVSASSDYELTISVIESSPALKSEVLYLNSQYIEIGELDYHLKATNAAKEKFIVLNLFPFIKEGNVIKRITKVKLTYSAIPKPVGVTKSFVTNSVLRPGSGTWYKISVPNDGIYKMDKSFLAQCGIDVENVNPQHINIYGNGEGRIPELNSVPRTDDLAKNAIVFVGENDGMIDDGDYILFYGKGAHRWYANGNKGFNQDRNPYSDVSSYFINVNPSEPPLRIATEASSSSPATKTITSYSYYDVHEVDLVSLVGGGQRWYGEEFDAQLQQTFTFSIPDVVSAYNVNFEVSMASNANSGSGTSQTYSVSGTSLFSTTLPFGTDWGRSVNEFSLSNPSSVIPLVVSVVRNSPDVITRLDRILLNARRNLTFISTQFNFRDTSSVGVGEISDFVVANLPAEGFIWDVTDRHAPKIISGVFNGADYTFRTPTSELREFVASNGIDFPSPARIGSVENQNLHALPAADQLIVTHKSFITQANRLADLHRAEGYTVHVVTTEQVFNEFSSGTLDAAAIRMFAKMFYDRSANLPETPKTRPMSLLLFGDGTYDPKNRVSNNNNYVLTYQVVYSEDHIAAMVTDDFFGMLDDNEAINPSDLMDIGVGRLLISDNTMAQQQVDKIEHYMKNGSSLFSSANVSCGNDEGTSTFGDWRTKYVQIADDEENGYFIKFDVEPQFDTVAMHHPEMNCDKIYLDAYQQIVTAGGQRYPDVNSAIDDRIERGALVINYVGHGGEVGVAEERVITVPQIQDWKNINKLPLIVSATCEFTKYDDPERVSAGEWASINPYGGAIALMTTTRSVFFGVNTDTGKSFYENVFERDANTVPRTFGEIIRNTKNGVLSGGNNKRSFTLIGDPGLHIALPRLNIVTDSINGYSPDVYTDTIRALSKVTIKGHIEDFNNHVQSGFNGTLYPSVYDKPKEQMTLGNDAANSPILPFDIQVNKLYRGKASVVNGYFEYTFIVPKDINYAIDYGKISYYADNGLTDGIGEEQRVFVGGIDPNGINDNVGPEIEIYLNDDSFVNGGMTDETPVLLVKLFDDNGINAVGNGVGHDLTAVLDGETGDPIVLNEYYSADMDSYQSGEIRYNFSELEPGEHNLVVKVWDVNNNSSEARLDFVVKQKEDLSLDHVLNYPNPFTTRTEFYFEHNQACDALEAQIQVFTVSGRLVKTINQIVHTEGFRSEGIAWDGRDDFGDQLAKGVYVYRLSVKAPDGSADEKLEKLVILK